MEISLRYRVQYMHIFEYNTRCSNGAMNADYNGASEGSQGQDSGRRLIIESVAIVRAEYLEL